MTRAVTADRFLLLDELIPLLGGNKTAKHLREIARDQNGGNVYPRFSQRCLASYPKFEHGPGKRWGCWLSNFEDWRESAR